MKTVKSCVFTIIDEVGEMERRSRCRHCRFVACEAAGMKPKYVTLDKKPTLMNFSRTLNTQQETMLNLCCSFWR